MSSQVQIPDSENNNQPSFVSTQYDSQENALQSHERQEDLTTPSNVTYVGQPTNNFQFQPTDNNAHVQTNSSTNLQIHPTVFPFRPPNDFYHYYVICKEISIETVANLLNKSSKERNVRSNDYECVFYYQQQYNNRLYQVSCEIISPLLVNKCLSKSFLGIELQQNMEQENLALTFGQKDHLECHLKKYLSQYVLEIKN
ncbi:hypothetical protein RclHR1_05690003 [Rhizophagus clarus]|uniref:Uncharacterized protein n=1 Tax=Rhizophagus clarus TaxID=94130 RepID=A0A2Z6S0Z9_9GLOM|nr:hypothetical protein RclHR1_05690003 [Rhizophagus clarus]GES73816.1 hypothetical protein GLOIN_2v1772812 [Rhizophagus clarus]